VRRRTARIRRAFEIESLSKLLVVVSIAGAVLLETFLTSRAWPGIWPLALLSFVASAVLGLLAEAASAAIALFLAFLMPSIVLAMRGDYFVSYECVWVAVLMGAIAPRSVRAGWSFPDAWKASLVLWALVVALTWPVVALRELDFTPALLNLPRLPVSGAKVNAPAAITWICEVVGGVGIGILWIDWLFLVFKRDEIRFRRWILAPLSAGWAVAVAVGIYQLFGDMGFLNNGLFASLQRASGTMHDANPFGVVAALGGPAFVAAASLTGRPRDRAIASVAMAASWLGVWATAGRTAFAAAVISSAFVAYGLWVRLVTGRRLGFRTRAMLGAAAALGLAALVFVFLLAPASSGLPARVRSTLPGFSAASIAAFLAAMWNRDGYGMVSSHLIGQFPLFGVGIGSFHLLVPDYYFLLTRLGFLNADNAQNWYRHQLVELGLVGSIGWILWVATFGRFVLGAAATGNFARTAVKGILVGAALVSLVGMPTQNVAVAVAFWTMAFWFVVLGPGGAGTDEGKPHQIRGTVWAAMWLAVALSVAGTAYTARHRLRVPQRAAAVGWGYAYGFSDVDPIFDVGRPSVGWAGRHAVAVLAPTAPLVKLTFAVDRLNLARGPVDARVVCDGVMVLNERVTEPQPIVRLVKLREGETRMVLETWASRAVRLSDYGIGDRAERGLQVAWEFFKPEDVR
jgi:hypothetical protein